MSGNDRIETWLGELRAALGALDDGDAATRWDEHVADEGVLVAAYGPYDAGKSTLLKRMLVADGTVVPGWLTVAGHPETDESRQVRSGDLVYLDTPGTHSGTDNADELAHLAAELADVLLVVLSPKLLGGDTARMLSTVRNAVRRAPASVLFVITQLDTLQDPEYDPDGYRAVADRKREELRTLLGSRGLPDASVHTVSADPYGRVGKKPTPRPEDYGEGADWDGIAELRAALYARVPVRTQLRRGAAARYWSGVGTRALAAANARAAALQAEIADAWERRRQAVELEQQLDGLDGRAEADLRRSVETELTSAARSVADPSLDSLLVLIEQRLHGVVGAWLARSGAELRTIAQGAAASGAVPQAATGDFRDYLRRVADLAVTRPGRDKSDFDTIVTETSRHASKLSSQIFKIRHGMTVDTARDELDRLNGFSTEKLAEYFAGDGKFGDHKHVEAVTKSVRTADVVNNILPTVAEFGTMLARQIGDAAKRKKAERREAELRGEIQGAVDPIIDRVRGPASAGGTGWTEAVASVRAHIQASAPTAEVIETMSTDAAHVRESAKAIEVLLAREPD